MKTIQYLLLAWLLVPHFCAAYEVSDRDFVVAKKATSEIEESAMPHGETLRAGSLALLARIWGSRGAGTQLSADLNKTRQHLLIATVTHSSKFCYHVSTVDKPVTIECVRNL